MYPQSCKCGQLAKGRLFWYVHFINISFDWRRLWCLLCLRNCSQVNNHKKLSLNGMSFPRLASSNFDLQSSGRIKRREVIINDSKASYRECFRKKFTITIKNWEIIIISKSIDHRRWWAWWIKSWFIPWKESALLGTFKEGENGCNWG